MERKPADVAKQLTGYADAVAAFSFVQSVAFGLALGGNDLPGKLKATPCWLIPLVMIVAFGFYGTIVYLCQNAADDLFSCTAESKGADAVIGRVRQWRIVVVVLVAALSTVGYGFTRYGPVPPPSPACELCRAAQPSH